jgi:hypothetical protein
MQPMKHKLIKAIRQMAIASIYAGGLIAAYSVIPVQAQETFGDAGLQFDTDTVIEFEFVESHGAYQSTFGVINLDTNEKTPLLAEVKPADSPDPISRPSTYADDTGSSTRDFPGTPGNTVPQPLAEFRFQARTRYAFYLESFYNGRLVGIVYSTRVQNPGQNQQTRFEGDLSALGSGGSVIRWDDTGSAIVRQNQKDTDFDDFIVRAGGHKACPFNNNVSTNQPDQKASYQAKSLNCQS